MKLGEVFNNSRYGLFSNQPQVDSEHTQVQRALERQSNYEQIILCIFTDSAPVTKVT